MNPKATRAPAHQPTPRPDPQAPRRYRGPLPRKPPTRHPAPRPERTRQRYLDVLRGIAVVLVLFRHVDLEISSYAESPLLFVILGILRRGGWIGVDLFFVLSGFLVSGLLLDDLIRGEGNVRVKRFLIRRGLKIYPAFYFMLITLCCLHVKPYELVQLLSEVFFVQNYVSNIWGHTWTLAIEEHFYLLLALCFWIGPKRYGRDGFLQVLRIGIPVVCLSVTTVRIYLAYTNEFTDLRPLLFPTHLRIDSLAFGVWLAVLTRTGGKELAFVRSLAGKHALWLLMPLIIVPNFLIELGASKFIASVSPTLLFLGFGWLLMWSSQFESYLQKSQSLTLSCLRGIGFYSYSIYLWHLPAAYVLSDFLMDQYSGSAPLAVVVVLYFAGSIAVGVLMARLVELPVIKIREWYFR